MSGEISSSMPENCVVLTLKQILDRTTPVLYVAHDQDGEWQFLSDVDAAEKDAAMVGLHDMIALDPSVLSAAKIPAGWVAWRNTPDDEWTMEIDN